MCPAEIAATQYAGARDGAVELTNSSGAVIATAYVYGTGTGPQVTFAPAVQSTVFDNATNGLSQPYNLAVGGSGDVYVADDTNNVVLKETPSGGSYTQSVVADASTNGLNSPAGVAVDGSRNDVYISDYNNSRVLKETHSGGSYTQTTVASSLNQPIGVAVDGGGNVYIGDRGLNNVLLEDVTTPPPLSFASTVVYFGHSSDSPKTVTLSNIGNATLNFPLPTTAGAFNPSVSANFTWDNRSSCQQTNSGTGTAYTLQAGASCTVDD